MEAYTTLLFLAQLKTLGGPFGPLLGKFAIPDAAPAPEILCRSMAPLFPDPAEGLGRPFRPPTMGAFDNSVPIKHNQK